MELVFSLITGAFGALLMVVFGMVAVIGLPVGAFLAVLSLIRGVKRGTRYYVYCFAVPIVCLVLSVGTFILRSFITLYFEAPPLALVFSL
jgi:hypothetical protein